MRGTAPRSIGAKSLGINLCDEILSVLGVLLLAGQDAIGVQADGGCDGQIRLIRGGGDGVYGVSLYWLVQTGAYEVVGVSLEESLVLLCPCFVPSELLVFVYHDQEAACYL